MEFEEVGDLVAGCNRITGYSELWNTLVVKGYFEVERLVMFKDFSELYMSSIASFFTYLCTLSSPRPGMLT